MLLFRKVAESLEMRLLHPRLVQIVEWLHEDGVWELHLDTPLIPVTDVWRSRQQTVRIYEAAGQPPPAYSVHETTKAMWDPMSGTRGIDLSARDARVGLMRQLTYAQWPMHDMVRLEQLEAAINASWRYNTADDKQVALLHSVSGLHLHLQVRPGDETKRRT